MASAKKKGLGKGLGALIASSIDDITSDTSTAKTQNDHSDALLNLDPRILLPNPKQPRADFDEETLQELAESIRIDGIIEPIVARKRNGKYEIVSGERRTRASIMADLETVPVVLRDTTDSEMLKIGLIENIQREDLNPIETANAYEQLVSEFSWTQEELAQQVGKKRATVTNTLRLLNLHPEVQSHVRNGNISMGHARALLAFERPEKQCAICRKVIANALSVRQTEKLASPKEQKQPKSPAPKDPNCVAIENTLRRELGTKVTLKQGKNNKGKIEIEYFNLDELDRILDILKRK